MVGKVGQCRVTYIQWTVYFQKARGRDFKCFDHKKRSVFKEIDMLTLICILYSAHMYGNITGTQMYGKFYVSIKKLK
jgi:hypothetical protein